MFLSFFSTVIWTFWTKDDCNQSEGYRIYSKLFVTPASIKKTFLFINAHISEIFVIVYT